jgi:amidase
VGFTEYCDYDGLGLADLIRRGEVSPAELVEAAIERIARHDPTLNAVVHQAYDEARRTASGLLPDGPFRGVPFLIKDLGCPVAGMPRTSGSRFLRHEAHERDGELTARYRAAGVVILGKTNTPELGITGTTESALLGPCRNPWNPDHIAGGSSGGAAAATASGMVPLAHASDGLGSIRIPAACCGLFGLKVTRERNPAGPDDAGRAIGFGVDHVVSRSVRDSAAMLDATGYPEPASPYPAPPKQRPYLEEIGRSPGRLRIAFSAQTPSGRPIHDEKTRPRSWSSSAMTWWNAGSTSTTGPCIGPTASCPRPTPPRTWTRPSRAWAANPRRTSSSPSHGPASDADVGSRATA